MRVSNKENTAGPPPQEKIRRVEASGGERSEPELASTRWLIYRKNDTLPDVANTYDYRSFGETLAATQGATSPYRFTSREFEAGGADYLHYYRNRYYNANAGIFTSRDAMWADIHRGWGYVGNLPTWCVDPYGLDGYDYRAYGPRRESLRW